MNDTQIGWLAAILVGGIAGWLAEQVTRSNMGILANVVLGVVGAGLASWLAAKLGFQLSGPVWLHYLIFGFVGAAILIIVTRLLYPNKWT